MINKDTISDRFFFQKLICSLFSPVLIIKINRFNKKQNVDYRAFLLSLERIVNLNLIQECRAD